MALSPVTGTFLSGRSDLGACARPVHRHTGSRAAVRSRSVRRCGYTLFMVAFDGRVEVEDEGGERLRNLENGGERLV